MKRHKKGPTEQLDVHERGHQQHRHHKLERGRKEVHEEKYVARKRSPQSSSSSVREDFEKKKRKRKPSSSSSSDSSVSPSSKHKMKKQRYRSPSPKGRPKQKKELERGRSREKKQRKLKDIGRIPEDYGKHRSYDDGGKAYADSNEVQRYRDDRGNSKTGKQPHDFRHSQKNPERIVQQELVKKSRMPESDFDSSSDGWSSGKPSKVERKPEKPHKKHKKEIEDQPREKPKKKLKDQDPVRPSSKSLPPKREMEERLPRDDRRYEEYDRSISPDPKDKYDSSQRYQNDSASDIAGKKKSKVKKKKKQKSEEVKEKVVPRKRSHPREVPPPEVPKQKKTKKHHRHEEDYSSESDFESVNLKHRKDIRADRHPEEWKTVDDIDDDRPLHRKTERNYSSNRNFKDLPRDKDRHTRYESLEKSRTPQERVEYQPRPQGRLDRSPPERRPERSQRSPDRRQEPTPEIRRIPERRPTEPKLKVREDKSIDRRRNDEDHYIPRGGERSLEYSRGHERKVENYEIREKMPPARYDDRDPPGRFEGNQERVPEKLRGNPRFYEKPAPARYHEKQFDSRDMRYNEQSSMRYEDAPRSRRQEFPEEQRTQKTLKYEREVLMNDIRPKPIRKLNDPRDRPDFPPQRTSSWDPDRDRKMRHRGSQDFEEQERTQRISSWVDGRDGAKLRIETREKFPREKWQPEGGRHRVDERKVEVEYSRGQSDRTNSGSRDRGRFPDDRPPAPSSRFTREVRQSGEVRSRDLGLEVTIRDEGGRSSIKVDERPSKARLSPPPRHVSYDASRDARPPGKRMYDSSKERPPHLAKVLRRDRSSSESKRSDKPVRREEYPATHSKAEESTRQSVNELIDRTRNYSSGRNMDAKGSSPSSQREEITRTKHGRLTHDRERSRASSKSRSSTRSPRRSRHSHHSIHQSSDREKSDRKSSKPRSSKDSKPNKSKEEKRKKKEEPTKPKAADVLEVDWPSLSPEKEITEPEPDSILNRFTPCNVLLDMGVSPSLLPAHLLEKVKTLCNENNQHANKKLVTTHELGALNRNESLRHSSWQAAFKARFPRLTSYEDAKFRRLALNRTQDPIPSTLPPAVINAKSYAASIKHYISKTKPIEVQ